MLLVCASVWQNNGSKVMGELQVEDAEEERFQADLKMAVRQSLGIIFSFHAYVVIFIFYI